MSHNNIAYIPFCTVTGRLRAKRAIEITAVGRHDILHRILVISTTKSYFVYRAAIEPRRAF